MYANLTLRAKTSGVYLTSLYVVNREYSILNPFSALATDEYAIRGFQQKAQTFKLAQ